MPRRLEAPKLVGDAASLIGESSQYIEEVLNTAPGAPEPSIPDYRPAIGAKLIGIRGDLVGEYPLVPGVTTFGSTRRQQHRDTRRPVCFGNACANYRRRRYLSADRSSAAPTARFITARKSSRMSRSLCRRAMRSRSAARYFGSSARHRRRTSFEDEKDNRRAAGQAP